MSIHTILQTGHSRTITNQILDAIAKNPALIDDLMACFFDANLRICQRAAWPVGDLGEKYPELIIPYLPEMIKNLTHPTFGIKNLYSSKLIFTDCGILKDCLLCFDLNFGKPFLALKKFENALSKLDIDCCSCCEPERFSHS